MTKYAKKLMKVLAGLQNMGRSAALKRSQQPILSLYTTISLKPA